MPRRLPVLDIRQFQSDKHAFIESLRDACHTVGFFLLRHDLPDGLAERQLSVTEQAFDLDWDTKRAVSYTKSPAFRGYMELGVENTAGKTDHREQYEFAAEYSTTGTEKRPDWPPYRRLESTNPWPTPQIATTSLEFAQHTCSVADRIRRGLCMALGLDENALGDVFLDNEIDSTVTATDATNATTNESVGTTPKVTRTPSPTCPHWVLKLVSYPPATRFNSSGETVDDTKEEELTSSVDDEQPPQQGVGAHTDTNFLTLVLQDTVGGLQVYSEGEWIDVPSVDGPSLLVCNLGEQAQVWSRGYFRATPHRVVPNTSSRRRMSVPLFYNPPLSATIHPLQTKDLPPSRRSVSAEHWERPQNAMLSSVGENTFKSLARSHPTVFAKHHPDLVLEPNGRIVRREHHDEK